jgi:hypothetical protein
MEPADTSHDKEDEDDELIDERSNGEFDEGDGADSAHNVNPYASSTGCFKPFCIGPSKTIL